MSKRVMVVDDSATVRQHTSRLRANFRAPGCRFPMGRTTGAVGFSEAKGPGMDEKTIDVLGIVIPNESPLFLAIVAVHIVIALVAVVSGVVAMLARKGVGRHSRFGSVYYWSMAARLSAMTP